MKIAVIGASGFVGDAVVRELAMRGHDVTAFARNAANIFSAPNVLAVATDVNDAAFAARLTGFDAVISAFNGGWTNPNLIGIMLLRITVTPENRAIVPVYSSFALSLFA